MISFDTNKDIHIKVTRFSEYGERYKLFVINKNSFQEKFNLENYGLNLTKEDNIVIVDNLKWNGLAKKSGFEIGDSISEFKVENLDRPNKSFIYPIALFIFGVFGYLNYKRKPN